MHDVTLLQTMFSALYFSIADAPESVSVKDGQAATVGGTVLMKFLSQAFMFNLSQNHTHIEVQRLSVSSTKGPGPVVEIIW